MRHTRKFMLTTMVLALSLACAIPAFAQPMNPAPGANQAPLNQAQPAPMNPARAHPATDITVLRAAPSGAAP